MKREKQMHNSFEKTVNKVINDTLNEIFTETATRVIYDHLDMNYQLKPDNMVQNIDNFREGMQKFLSTGALAVESIIIQRLYDQFRVKYENRKDWTFADYMKDLKRQIASP